MQSDSSIAAYSVPTGKEASIYFLRHLLSMPFDDLMEACSGDVGGVSASLFDKKLSRPSPDCRWLWFVSTTDSNDGLASSCGSCCCVADSVDVGWSDSSLAVDASEGATMPWLRVFLCFGLRWTNDRCARLRSWSVATSFEPIQALDERSASGCGSVVFRSVGLARVSAGPSTLVW